MTDPKTARHVEITPHHVEVRDDHDRTAAVAEVTTDRCPAGTVRASMYAKSERARPGDRITLVDAVMDLPEVQASSRMEATILRGDVESLEHLKECTDDAVLRAAGATTLLDANIRRYHGQQLALACSGGGWSVAVVDLALGAAGFGAAVGVQDEGPAEPVDAHLVVVGAQQDQVFEPGGAAVRAVDDVVHLAAGRRLVAAARPYAVPVPQDDRAAQVAREILHRAHVQRQALAAERDAELAGAQVGG